jgi:signal peptidase
MAKNKKEEGFFKKHPHVKDILEILAAFAIAWLFYQFLIIITGTSMPLVSVVSGSMEPVLHRGDLVFAVGEPNPKTGDIIVYNRADFKYTIIHRVIAVTDQGYILKGDNNPGPDPGFANKNQFIGKAVFAVPLLGYPRLALSELTGYRI